MFALLAVITFVLGFLLVILKVAVPAWLLWLGFALLSGHFVYAFTPWDRYRNRPRN